MKEGPERKLTRRAVLTGAIGAVAAGAVAGAIEEFGRESLEKCEASETFDKEVAGYRMLYGQIRRDEILFVDDFGAPLEKVKLQAINGISPGIVDAHGILRGALDREWLAAERSRLHKKYPSIRFDIERHLPRELNVFQPIREVVDAHEADPGTYMDIVHHFGDRDTIGHRGVSRIEYVRSHVMDGVALPAAIRDELSDRAPGIAAQESHFNNAAHSRTGAAGIFQFEPRTFGALGYRPEDILSLEKQVGAAGEYFRDMYGFIRHHAASALEKIAQAAFTGNEEHYERYFLTPMLVNAYNVGQGRMSSVVAWFADHLEHDGLHFEQYPRGFGYDVFMRMAHLARAGEHSSQALHGYGDDAAQYVPRVYALASLLE